MGGSGRVRSGLMSLEFYDPNPTRPAIKKKKFVTQPNPTQPNPPSPENRPNLVGWVRFGRATSWLHTPSRGNCEDDDLT